MIYNVVVPVASVLLNMKHASSKIRKFLGFKHLFHFTCSLIAVSIFKTILMFSFTSKK
jgi:hypothetical protein